MAQTNESQEQVTVNVETLQPVTRTLMTIGALPTSYLISMTYEEQLLWLQNYLIQTVIPAINNNAEATEEVQNIVMALQDYINDYFNNLDVQEEINNKLEEMAQDGSLTTLIEDYVNPYIEAQNQEIANFKTSVNGQIAQQNAQIQAVENGSPLVASSTAGMTDTTKTYVNTTDGYWYYYNGTQWIQGGIYQTTGISDGTITPEKTTFIDNNAIIPTQMSGRSMGNANIGESSPYYTKTDTSEIVYLFNVDGYYNSGKKHVYIKIKDDFNLIRIGRSSSPIETYINNPTSPQLYFSMRYKINNGDITKNEYLLSISLTEDSKTVGVYLGNNNTNPYVRMGTYVNELINSPYGDYISIKGYPKCDNDLSDSERIQRAFDENENKTIFFPYDQYDIAAKINGTNISMKCDNQAHFIGSVANNFMFDLSFTNSDHRHFSVEGGWFDGNYVSSCLRCSGGHNVTIRDCMFMDGIQYGFRLQQLTGISTSKYYINNCTARGTEDRADENIAFSLGGTDHSVVDCVVSNYYTAFAVWGGATRFERCHPWNVREQLIDKTIGFKVNSAGNTFIDCYVDTMKIGFDIYYNTQLMMINGYNNTEYGMTNETYFYLHDNAKAIVIGGHINSVTGQITNNSDNLILSDFDALWS